MISEQSLVEKEAIKSVLIRLFTRTDARDWAAVQDCFAESVQFDMTSSAGGQPMTLTPQEITKGWEKALAPIKIIHHQAGNFEIQIEGMRARASCYGIAYHYLPNRSGHNTRTFVGSYDIGLRRDAKGWAIDQFKFNLKFVDGNLDLEKS